MSLIVLSSADEEAIATSSREEQSLAAELQAPGPVVFLVAVSSYPLLPFDRVSLGVSGFGVLSTLLTLIVLRRSKSFFLSIACCGPSAQKVT